VQLLAVKFVAFAAMLQLLALHTVFDGAALCPVRLFDVGAAGAFHDLSVLAFAAFKTATGFEHGMVHSFMNVGIRMGINDAQSISEGIFPCQLAGCCGCVVQFRGTLPSGSPHTSMYREVRQL
jgi:hypothetical protein